MNRLKTRRWRDGENRLSVFAMQFYYTDTANATNPDKHLFDSTGVSGGLHFDRNDVAATLAEAKGYTRYFVNYLATLPPTERLFITQQLPDLRDWYIQAGSDALNATAGTQRAFLLGGTGDDNLTGSDQADLLVGGIGIDTLNGGDGEDTHLLKSSQRDAKRWRWQHGGKRTHTSSNDAHWRIAA